MVYDESEMLAFAVVLVSEIGLGFSPDIPIAPGLGLQPLGYGVRPGAADPESKNVLTLSIPPPRNPHIPIQIEKHLPFPQPFIIELGRRESV